MFWLEQTGRERWQNKNQDRKREYLVVRVQNKLIETMENE